MKHCKQILLTIIYTTSNTTNNDRVYPLGVIVKAMDCGIVVSEFEPHSFYYIHSLTNTLEKGMNFFTLPDMG